tara:strand:+ start:310 stop:786 length:477 start_codon:yes stop_codon:yes gene_type:complete
MPGKKREKPATGGFRKDYDGQVFWGESFELDDATCQDIIKAGGLAPTNEFVTAIKDEVSRYVHFRESERRAPHGGGSGRTSDHWEQHARKMIELYEAFGGTYGLGRKNPSRKHLEGYVGSPFLEFAKAINAALPREFARQASGPEYARAIRRARQKVQ